MAPKESLGKRVKLTSVYRPFVYGTTAIPFDPVRNPKPPGLPDNHTHSWTVFVRGIDEDVDVTYWLRRVQFKLHETVPNPVRMIDGQPGKPFIVHETGWGEFDITIKLYYPPESGEKPQTLYHYLRIHPFAEKEDECDPSGEVRSWVYEEQVFNEPYETFYNTLTTGAHPKNYPGGAAAALAEGGAGAGKGKTRSGKDKQAVPVPPLPDPGGDGDVWQRTAMLPPRQRPGQPFSRDTERLDLELLAAAYAKVKECQAEDLEKLHAVEAELEKVRAENIAAADPSGPVAGPARAGRKGSKLVQAA